MLLITQKPAAPGNFRVGRHGHQIVGIVIHVEDGCEMGSIAWFENPAAKVSAHYSVSKAGDLFQHVQEQDEAFHAGTVVNPTWTMLVDETENPNLFTIGIEHEGLATDDWPEPQYQASAQLIADVAQRNHVPIDAAHIVGHHQIRANKTCPGNCDMGKLIALALAAAS